MNRELPAMLGALFSRGPVIAVATDIDRTWMEKREMIAKTMLAAVVGVLVVGCGNPGFKDDRGDWTLTEEEADAGDTGTGSDASDAGHNPDTGDVGSKPDVTFPPRDTGPDANPDTDLPPVSCLPSAPLQHRPAPSECDEIRDSTQPDPDPSIATCTTHADCDEGENGRCVGNPHDSWYCTYDDCFADDECGNGSVCECEGGFRSDHNVCLAGNCRTDADCGETGFCSPSMGQCGDYAGTVGYFCRTCEDECVNDSDCGGSNDGWGDPFCMFEPGVSKWVCSNSHCAG